MPSEHPASAETGHPDSDDTEFARFVDEHHEALLRYAVMLTGSRWDAEDIVQDALIGCLRRWRRVEVDRRLAYARQAVCHEFLGRVRRRRLFTVALTEEPPPSADDTVGVVDRLGVLAELRTLPPRQRAAIVARFWLDLSERDTAAELGCGVGTVKSLTSRGLARLRQRWLESEPAVLVTGVNET